MFRGSIDNSPTKVGQSASMVSQSHNSNQSPQHPINKEHIIPPDEVEPKIATNATIFGEKIISNDAKKDPPVLVVNATQKRRKLACETGQNELDSSPLCH